jgi:nucleoid-associated protein YgaU
MNAPSTAPSPSPPTLPVPTSRIVVRRGDNLWVIARDELVRRTGAKPDVVQIARYWRAVIEANRATLRSGNPSLIFPGEIVALPAVPPVS